MAVEGRRDAQRQASRGAGDGCLDLAVERLGLQHDSGLQARLEAAAGIEAAQGVSRLTKAHPHAPDLRSKAAHREQQTPPRLSAQGPGEDESRARDLESHRRSGGMVAGAPQSV